LQRKRWVNISEISTSERRIVYIYYSFPRDATEPAHVLNYGVPPDEVGELETILLRCVCSLAKKLIKFISENEPYSRHLIINWNSIARRQPDAQVCRRKTSIAI